MLYTCCKCLPLSVLLLTSTHVKGCQTRCLGSMRVSSISTMGDVTGFTNTGRITGGINFYHIWLKVRACTLCGWWVVDISALDQPAAPQCYSYLSPYPPTCPNIGVLRGFTLLSLSPSPISHHVYEYSSQYIAAMAQLKIAHRLRYFFEWA